MATRRIDRFLNEALKDFSDWLNKNPQWKGKEHDCVNLFAHNFLFPKIETGAAIEHPTQVCIECALRQPKGYVNRSARKDLVIWEAQFQNTWSENWEAIRSPKAVMEWKVYRKRMPKQIFDKHDEKWIAAYTKEEPDRFGFVVSLELSSDQPKIYWKQAKAGVFGKPFSK
jgi:hypothetical protein